jgi:Flp pilus assembly protein TadD
MAIIEAEVFPMIWGRVRASGFAAVAAVMLAATAGCETLSQEQPQESEAEILPIIEPVAPETLILVERALAEGRFDDAGRLIERVLLTEPENWEAQLLVGELHLASGDVESAASIFESLVDNADVGARALQGLGIALTLQGVLDRGVENLQQAVAQDPGLWRAWNALGYYHDSNRDWPAAADSYGKALEGNPESTLIYNNRGFSMLMQRRLEEAVADFNRVLQMDPDFEVARENLRLALAWQGKYIHAMAGAPEADMARILNNVGFIALMRGDYGNAEAYLLRAMEADPAYNATAARNLTYLKQVRELAEAESEPTAN